MFFTDKEIIVFDFDGVLVDSNKIKFDAFFDIWNVHISKNSIKRSLLLGGDRRKVINRIYRGENTLINSKNGPEFFVEAYSKLVHKEIVKIGISSNIINFLMSSNKSLFINSATPEKELIKLTNDLNISQYFLGIYGAPNSKKDNFNIIFENNNIKAKHVAFYGDMQSDKDIADEMNIKFYKILSKESDLR